MHNSRCHGRDRRLTQPDADDPERVIQAAALCRQLNPAAVRAGNAVFRHAGSFGPGRQPVVLYGGLAGQQICQPQPHTEQAYRQCTCVFHADAQRTLFALFQIDRRVQSHTQLFRRAQMQRDAGQRRQHEKGCRRCAQDAAAERVQPQNRQQEQRISDPKYGHTPSRLFRITGISTFFRISSTICSALRSIMRAFVLSIRRWQQTSGKIAATSSGIA